MVDRITVDAKYLLTTQLSSMYLSCLWDARSVGAWWIKFDIMNGNYDQQTFLQPLLMVNGRNGGRFVLG